MMNEQLQGELLSVHANSQTSPGAPTSLQFAGDLILAGSLLNLPGEKIKVFEIVIQAGAILAVCWEFRARLLMVLRGLTSDPRAQRFAINVTVAFLPAAVLGLAFQNQKGDVEVHGHVKW